MQKESGPKSTKVCTWSSNSERLTIAEVLFVQAQPWKLESCRTNGSLPRRMQGSVPSQPSPPYRPSAIRSGTPGSASFLKAYVLSDSLGMNRIERVSSMGTQTPFRTVRSHMKLQSNVKCKRSIVPRPLLCSREKAVDRLQSCHVDF